MKKKILFCEKLDNNPMLCSKCEYNQDMIINKCLGLKDLKAQQKICIFSMNLYKVSFRATFTLTKSVHTMFLTFHVNVFQHSLKQGEKFNKIFRSFFDFIHLNLDR